MFSSKKSTWVRLRYDKIVLVHHFPKRNDALKQGRKGLALPILILVLTVGTSYAKDLEIKKKAGDFDVEVKIDRNPPIVGDNSIEIEIKKAGKPVTDAKVLITYYMPPMPRMAPMNYKTDAKLKKEKYKATMNLIMAGPWYIAVIITHEGKISRTKLNIDAQ